MTNLELVLNMLAEATTSEISKEKHPKSFEDSKRIAKQGGKIAEKTRREKKEKTGKRFVKVKMLNNLIWARIISRLIKDKILIEQIIEGLLVTSGIKYWWCLG